MPSTTSLFKESKQVPIPVESVNTNVPDLLLSSTQDLSDTLFFIQFTPAGTMLRKWYLVQIDLESTLVVNPDYAINGEYWCVLLARHSADKQKVMKSVDGGLNGTATKDAPSVMILYMEIDSNLDHLPHNLVTSIFNGQHFSILQATNPQHLSYL